MHSREDSKSCTPNYLFIYLFFFALLEEQNGGEGGGGAFCFNIFTVPAQTIIKGIYLN